MFSLQTEKEFDNLIGKGIVLVDFFAEWCGPCKIMSPILDSISEKYNDSVLILKVNVDNFPDLAKTYDVMSIPTLILFQDGEQVDLLTGVRTKAAISSIIDKLV
jgi:thioredoxin 1